MALARADKYSPNDIQVTYYTDFTPNLDLNPITKLLATVNNEDAVKQSIYLLMRTMIGERPIDNVNVGSIIENLIFELDDPITMGTLETTIRQTIQNHEPRATLLDVQVASGETIGAVGRNQVAITIIFSLNNVNTVSSVTVFFKRVR